MAANSVNKMDVGSDGSDTVGGGVVPDADSISSDFGGGSVVVAGGSGFSSTRAGVGNSTTASASPQAIVLLH